MKIIGAILLVLGVTFIFVINYWWTNIPFEASLFFALFGVTFIMIDWEKSFKIHKSGDKKEE
jgi:hypothetical protein